MSTRSYVAFAFPPTKDGRPGVAVRATYIHNDGYLAGVGKMLQTSYNDALSAFSLAGAGYISSLGSGDLIACLANSYNHDAPIDYASTAEFLSGAVDHDAEFAYLWRDGMWYATTTFDKSFKPLAPLLAALDGKVQ